MQIIPNQFSHTRAVNQALMGPATELYFEGRKSRKKTSKKHPKKRNIPEPRLPRIPERPANRFMFYGKLLLGWLFLGQVASLLPPEQQSSHPMLPTSSNLQQWTSNLMPSFQFNAFSFNGPVVSSPIQLEEVKHDLWVSREVAYDLKRQLFERDEKPAALKHLEELKRKLDYLAPTVHALQQPNLSGDDLQAMTRYWKEGLDEPHDFAHRVFRWENLARYRNIEAFYEVYVNTLEAMISGESDMQKPIGVEAYENALHRLMSYSSLVPGFQYQIPESDIIAGNELCSIECQLQLLERQVREQLSNGTFSNDREFKALLWKKLKLNDRLHQRVDSTYQSMEACQSEIQKVRQNGTGIDPNSEEKIFWKFQEHLAEHLFWKMEYKKQAIIEDLNRLGSYGDLSTKLTSLKNDLKSAREDVAYHQGRENILLKVEAGETLGEEDIRFMQQNMLKALEMDLHALKFAIASTDIKIRSPEYFRQVVNSNLMSQAWPENLSRYSATGQETYSWGDTDIDILLDAAHGTDSLTKAMVKATEKAFVRHVPEDIDDLDSHTKKGTYVQINNAALGKPETWNIHEKRTRKVLIIQGQMKKSDRGRFATDCNRLKNYFRKRYHLDPDRDIEVIPMKDTQSLVKWVNAMTKLPDADKAEYAVILNGHGGSQDDSMSRSYDINTPSGFESAIQYARQDQMQGSGHGSIELEMDSLEEVVVKNQLNRLRHFHSGALLVFACHSGSWLAQNGAPEFKGDQRQAPFFAPPPVMIAENGLTPFQAPRPSRISITG